MGISRIIDSNIFIYALNQSHPCYSDCIQYLQQYDGPESLFTCTDVFFEIYHALTIYYGINPKTVTKQLELLSESNIQFHSLSIEEIVACFNRNLSLAIDIIDYRLFYLAEKGKVPIIVTDDFRFGKFIQSQGLIWETPIKSATREDLNSWENAHMPPKGLPRILTHNYRYLEKIDKKISEKFKQDTNQLTQLPFH
jgi:predicted nucleic acid-binding protein